MNHVINQTINLFFIVLPIVFIGLPLPLAVEATNLHLIYCPYWNFYRLSTHISKPPKARLYHFSHNRCYTNFLPTIFITDYIISSISTHPRHHHLCNIDIIFLLAFDHLTFSLIQHH